jgi:hypothetical protein
VLPHESDKSRKLMLETEKLDCLVWQIGWCSFVDSDGSQGRRRHSTRELLLQPSDIWTEDRQEPQQSKGLKWQIIDLIYKKKK